MTSPSQSTDRPSGPRIGIVTQVFPPDPAAVGQYLEEVAKDLAANGIEVTVITADRGYDDPAHQFPQQELRQGVQIERLGWAQSGKGSLLRRLLGQISFCAQAFLKLFFHPPDSLLVSTSPPMAPAVAVLLKLLRGTPFSFWVMDINPDQAVRLGILKETHPLARAHAFLIRRTLRHAREVITLDTAMAATLRQHEPSARARLFVLPLWPLPELPEANQLSGQAFRQVHQIGSRRLLLYSGNHSTAHPLEAYFKAVRQFTKKDDSLCFAFVGGGAGKHLIEGSLTKEPHKAILSLPYQPLRHLPEILAAGDVHVVAFGPQMVGVVHPSKFYAALSAGKPILLVGPESSPHARIIRELQLGWIAHPEAPEASLKALQQIALTPSETLETMGKRSRQLATTRYSKEHGLKELRRLLLP